MSAIGARLPLLSADLVALQEVWTRGARDELLQAGRRVGLLHSWHGGAPLGGGGLLVLSRLPIRAVRFEPFAIQPLPQHPHHVDYWGGKGYAALQVDLGEDSLTLIDTHLQARYGRDVDHEYRCHRAGQAVEVALATRASEAPVVVCGDFNFQERDDEYKVLTGLSGLIDVAARLDRREPTLLASNPYRRGSRRDRRIDLILVRDGARHALIPRSIERVFDEPIPLSGGSGACSDHAGLVADLELRAEAQPASPPPDPAALELAAALLFEGQREAERRRRGGRIWAGAGLGGAVLATAGFRAPGFTRRHLLRGALAGAGLLALTPGLALPVLAEVYLPGEIRAFAAVAERLARLLPLAPWKASSTSS